jgi:hypothetical protein
MCGLTDLTLTMLHAEDWLVLGGARRHYALLWERSIVDLILLQLLGLSEVLDIGLLNSNAIYFRSIYGEIGFEAAYDSVEVLR